MVTKGEQRQSGGSKDGAMEDQPKVGRNSDMDEPVLRVGCIDWTSLIYILFQQNEHKRTGSSDSAQSAQPFM